MGMTVAELAQRIGATVEGDGQQTVTRCASLTDADALAVSFLANRRYAGMLRTTRAGAVVLSPREAPRATHLTRLVADDPYFAFREAVVALHGFRRQPAPGVHPQAVVCPDATLGEGCAILPTAVIDAGARLGKRCVIYPHCYIGRDTSIGDDCTLYPNVTIYDGCVLGDRVTIHAGSVIGEDGFGYATRDGKHHKIPQVGNVVIEDDVEIGANCAIDRATVGSTFIGQGTKFSNSIVIGHGSRIGPHNLFVAQVGVAGSATTGSHVAVGGQTAIIGHITIGDRAQIAAKTGVLKNIPPDSKFGGYAAVPLEDMKKIAGEVLHLPHLARDVEDLRKRMDELEREKGTKAPRHQGIKGKSD